MELEILVGEIRHLDESIKGRSDMGASILRSTIGKVADFAEEGPLAVYVSIVPRNRVASRGDVSAVAPCALLAAPNSSYWQANERRMAATKNNRIYSRTFLGSFSQTAEDQPRRR